MVGLLRGSDLFVWETFGVCVCAMRSVLSAALGSSWRNEMIPAINRIFILPLSPGWHDTAHGTCGICLAGCCLHVRKLMNPRYGRDFQSNLELRLFSGTERTGTLLGSAVFHSS